MSKDKDYNRLIHTARWRSLRQAKLSRDPLCERCLEEGRVRSAREVHHVQPVEDGLTLRDKEALMFDPRNLQALCPECHDRVHTEMGRSGKANAKRRAAEQLARFKKKFLGQGPGGVF